MQAASETDALQAAITKLDRKVEEPTWQLQLEKQREIEEAKTQEIQEIHIQAAKENVAPRTSISTLETQVEEVTRRLQLEKRTRDEIKEVNTEDTTKFQTMLLKFEETVTSLVKERKDEIEEIKTQETAKFQEMLRRFEETVIKLVKEREASDQAAAERHWGEHRGNTVMMVASFLAAVTCAITLNPPGGFWRDNSEGHAAGLSILAYSHPVGFGYFLGIMALILIASLTMLLILGSGVALRRGLFFWFLVMLMWVSGIFLALAFLLSISIFTPSNVKWVIYKVIGLGIFFWIALMVFLIISHAIPSMVRRRQGTVER